MKIEIKPVVTRKDLRTFIYLPEKINAGHPLWLHPIYMDEWNFYQPKHNKSFSYCDTMMVLAFGDGKPVGRLMGLINHQYNDLHNEPYARFYAFECIEDQQVAHALLTYCENWARQKGMKKMIGPLGFSDKDPQGLLVEGFDLPPVIASPCNQKYLVHLVENDGFAKFKDLVEYWLDVPEEIPEVYRKVSQRTLSTGAYVLREFKTKSELKKWIKPVFILINEAFMDIYGFVPLSDKEIDELVGKYLPILDPRFVKIVTTTQGETIGFIVSMPDISEGIRKARGRILPFGLFHIIRSSRKTKKIVSLLGAIKAEYRGRGLDTLMGMSIFETAHHTGMKIIDSHLVLELNSRMRREYERMGGIVKKRFRIYEKNL